ncbi:outer membrane beta-barrel protein [Sphingobacterium corticis]|uniref:Outer membrane beta-barrel protein n=1 Tax=Sphingobacterium corticis TaxID=1812823 RepID=A0ABW5NEU6_9SPHI
MNLPFLKKILLSVFITITFQANTIAQTSNYSVGLFADMMMESPGYDTYYGVNGKYDFSKHSAVQAFVGYSNIHITTIGADYIYQIFDKEKSNFNIYGGLGFSGDFYRKTVHVEFGEYSASGKVKMNLFAINPTIGISYHAPIINSSIFAGYKAKYYPFENAVDINFLSVGLRYHF